MREVYLILWAEQLPCLPLPEPGRLHCPKSTYYVIKKHWVSSVCPQNRCSASSVSPRKKMFCEKMYGMIHLLLQIFLIALSVTLAEEKSKETQRRPLYWRLFWILICWAPWNSFHCHLLILEQALAELNKWFFQCGPAKAAQQHPGRCSDGNKINNVCYSGQVQLPVVFQYKVKMREKKWKCLLGKSLGA